jgi:K+-transporting ATPase ATPase C chain
MKHLMPSLRLLLVLTIALGLFYPLAMTWFSQLLFPHQALGSLIRNSHGEIIGAELISQKFERPEYFWGRPSAVDFNPLPSGGSNLGPTNTSLQKSFEERKAKLMASHPGQGEPPQDLLFASASGLDPEISPEAARYQIMRVALARKIDPSKIGNLVSKLTLGPQFGIFGMSRVNVLKMNLELDELSQRQGEVK